MPKRKPGARPGWIDALRSLPSNGDSSRLLAMMGLYFLVVCAVGVLRPIRNSLALDGLGATDFAKVYLVSAVVLLFAPVFNRLSDLLPWRTLFSVTAAFFATNLLLFRLYYEAGSGTFGMVFYAWYDLFAAALVVQFFLATQFYFDARSAKRAYPIVIAGGSIGATLGGGITGFFAESLGTPNLLLVAATFIALFAAGIPWVLSGFEGGPKRDERPALEAGRGTLAELFADRQVRLIAGTVLLTILVKQLVDYQFNIITREVFETRDAVTAFQGKFNAATQWLPLIVLAGLRPAMKRWGMGVAVLLLPVMMLGTTVGLALTFGLWAAVAAKGAETSLRYSAERAGREMLYVPVRDEIKLKAKTYIDVGIEKGLGKVLSGVLLIVLLSFIDYRQVGWVAAGLACVWVAAAMAVRAEYVRTLAQSIEGRFASLRGIFATFTDASTLPVVREALVHESPLRAAFALELLGQLTASELQELAPELNGLIAHERPEIRAAALDQLQRIPEELDADAARAHLQDEVPAVREAAVRALLAHAGDAAPALLGELLRSHANVVRTAALSCICAAPASAELRAAGRAFADAHTAGAMPAEPELRQELALAAATFDDGTQAIPLLDALLDDADARVRATALRSAGRLGLTDCCSRMIAALADRSTRAAAREALATLGPVTAAPLEAALLDETTSPRVRRAIPGTLARFPTQHNVDAMLRLILDPATDQILDYRMLKALSKIRAANPELAFDEHLVHAVAARECDAAGIYAGVLVTLENEAAPAPGTVTARSALRAIGNGAKRHRDPRLLLARTLEEAFRERREGVFRCLGMLHPPDHVRRAHVAVCTGSAADRGKALEWIEETIGPARFRRLNTLLEPPRATTRMLPVAALLNDEDSWISLLANAVTSASEPAMELIEKVFLLQNVDLLRGARSAHVALLASIASEVDVPAGTLLIEGGATPAAMYVVTRGSVELHGVGQRLVVGPEDAFGTWALIDEQPSHIEARTLVPTRLLRVTRDDFQDLLADHSELALGLLQGLAHRMRSLVAQDTK
jgi:ATP/ADP translocase/HEAT repeat protein